MCRIRHRLAEVSGDATFVVLFVWGYYGNVLLVVLFCRFVDGLLVAAEGSEGGKLGSTLHHRHARMALRCRVLKIDDISVIV